MSHARQPIRVLHLEADDRDAELIRHKLDSVGLDCDITRARDREQFEAALARESFQVILCDNDLRGLDGCLSLTLAQEKQPDVPVIIVSDSQGEEQAVECLRLGATDYLLKERLERLGPVIRRALREAEGQRE